MSMSPTRTVARRLAATCFCGGAGEWPAARRRQLRTTFYGSGLPMSLCYDEFCSNARWAL
jgi:hypothetical protein